MNMTHRTLNFTITKESFTNTDDGQEYIDLITIASLFNAISYARFNGAHYQLASFSLGCEQGSETVYITGGLLFNAFIEIERLIGRYKKKAYVNDFENILESFEYKPPEVLLEVCHAGPFRLVTEKRDFSFQTHKLTMFPEFTKGQKGFAVATVADESEKMQEFKRTEEPPEVHENLERIVEFLTDEFRYGAEEFIFNISKKLGLKPIEQQRLAA